LRINHQHALIAAAHEQPMMNRVERHP
jgi:hypothetical protein